MKLSACTMISIIACIAGAGWPLCRSVQGETITYTADNSLIPNPERGYWTFNSNNFGSQGLPSPLSGMMNYINGLRQSHGVTTIVTTYGLSALKTTAQLPQNVLSLIDGDFATARTNGYKLVPRFTYCDRNNGADATPTIIDGHLRQLKPIFAKNVDVMALGGLGMYGYWGEQWGTANSTGYRSFEANSNTRAIFASMLDAVPINRMIMMRYTRTMRQLMGDAPCPENEAFTGTARSRVGHYNDCFMDEGSSENNADEGPWSYTSVQGAWTPDLATDMSCASNYTDSLIMVNLDKQHFDFARLDNGSLGNACLQTLDKYVGYRYRLISATLQDSVKPGNSFALNIVMTNDGYGAIFNPRKVEIILRNQSGGAKYWLNVIGDDTIRCNRTYLPRSHETKTLSITGGVPATVPSGRYDVLLNLPDPYPSIHDRPDYSIHCANTNMWEATTGYNSLSHTLVVSAATHGTAYSGTAWFTNGGTGTRDFTMQNSSGAGQITVPLIMMSGSRIAALPDGAGLYDIRGRTVNPSGTMPRGCVIIMKNGRK